MLRNVYDMTLRGTNHHRYAKMTRRNTHHDIEWLHVKLAGIVQNVK